MLKTHLPLTAHALEVEQCLDKVKVFLTVPYRNKNTEIGDLTPITGTVTRVNQVVVDGNQTISFMLEADENVYRISASNNVYSMFLKEGDKVSFEANIQEDDLITTLEDMTIETVTPK